jgi:glycosyltransferase involved in cell wall biosynthesis
VRQALWDAHALVLPSRYETFGVVLVEAMATGLPCLATRCGGPEAVLSPATGRLLDPHRHDEDAFVRALAHELTALREGFVDYDAGAIRAHAVARFGADAFARRTLFLYREALRRHASRPARLR